MILLSFFLFFLSGYEVDYIIRGDHGRRWLTTGVFSSFSTFCKDGILFMDLDTTCIVLKRIFMSVIPLHVNVLFSFFCLLSFCLVVACSCSCTFLSDTMN